MGEIPRHIQHAALSQALRYRIGILLKGMEFYCPVSPAHNRHHIILPITKEERDETYRKTKVAKVAKGIPRNLAYLLINCSRPCLLSSIKDSSKIPSSPRKGSCRFKAFPGSGGTTICRQTQNISHTGEHRDGIRW